MKRTYKYRLYPTKEQEAILIQWLITCRILYNNSFEEIEKRAYQLISGESQKDFEISYSKDMK